MFAKKIKNIDRYFHPESICNSIYDNYYYGITKAKIMMEWIPYSQFTNVKEIARGGFGIIYQATWLDGPIYKNTNTYRIRTNRNKKNEIVILKRFKNSQDVSKYFLNEVNTLIFTL